MTSQLVEQSTRHQVFLERVKTGEANQFAAFLRRIDEVIKKRLSGDITELSRARFERLLTSIDGSINRIYDDYWDELSGNLIDIGEYESEFESRSLDGVLANFETVIPAPEQVRAAIFSAPLSVRGTDGGKLLEPFVKDWSTIETKRVTGAIRQGFFEGQTNSQILRAVRGTRANKYRDGILAISNRNAEAVVRTAVQHAASVARQETWNSNSRVVVGVEWVSTLDSRTTQICRSLDGLSFPRNSGPRPPTHIRCRSTTVAKLDGRFDIFKQGQTRSSKNGPVSANETYYSWLKKQPAAFQKEAIGKTRAQLLRNGGLSAQRFAELNIGKKFEPLTLKEMRKLEPLAFEKSAAAAPFTKAAEVAKIKESSQRQALLADWVSEKEYRSEVGRLSNPRIKKEAEKHDLTEAEQVAIGHYSKTGYYDLNNGLRSGDRSENERVSQAANVLRQGLDKLPDHKGRVVRRDHLPDAVLSKHAVGEIVRYDAFTSSTFSTKDVMGDLPHRVIIHSTKGKNIDWISFYHKQEHEVLFTSPTKFEVIGREKVGDIIQIELMEIVDG